MYFDLLLRNYAICVALLIALTGGTDSLNRTELIKKCRYEGNMCEIDTSCFTELHKEGLITYCDEFPFDTPKKYEDLDQALSFRPEEYVLEEDMPPDVTYSVVLSLDSTMDNLTLLPGCCNLDPNDKNDTCRMNATFDQTKKFNVVFPFKKDSNPNVPLYCRYRIAYDNVHYEFCKDDEEIVEPCLIFTKDGEVRIKYRYTSLTYAISSNIKTTRCYFPVSRELVPRNKTDTQVSFEVNDMSFVTMARPDTAIVRGVNHSCQLYAGVESNHKKIAEETYKKMNGDFICCGIKSLSKNSDDYYQNVLCINTQVWQIVIPLEAIILSLSAFLALLLLIATLKGWQLYRKIIKHKQQSQIPFVHYNSRDDRREICAVDPVNDTARMDESVDKIECQADDDSFLFNEATALLETADEQGDNVEEQSNHDNQNGTENQNAMERDYRASLESGCVVGMTSDFEFTTSGDTSADSGYMPKPTDSEVARPHKYQDSPSLFAKSRDTSADSGYMPKPTDSDVVRLHKYQDSPILFTASGNTSGDSGYMPNPTHFDVAPSDKYQDSPFFTGNTKQENDAIRVQSIQTGYIPKQNTFHCV